MTNEIIESSGYLARAAAVACRNRLSGRVRSAVAAKAATAFLFKLIAQLQFSGTVPMIDVDAYAKWLVK
jgi:hypothetical protein